MPKFRCLVKVIIHYDAVEVEVEAASASEAYDLALDAACDAELDGEDIEYDVIQVEELP